jgi:hypothetical protein
MVFLLVEKECGLTPKPLLCNKPKNKQELMPLRNEKNFTKITALLRLMKNCFDLTNTEVMLKLPKEFIRMLF